MVCVWVDVDRCMCVCVVIFLLTQLVLFVLTQLVLFLLAQLVLFLLTQLVLFAGMWEILPVLIPSIGDSKITVRRGVMQVRARECAGV